MSRARSSGYARRSPDVVLLDVHLPGGGGRAILEALRDELTGTRYLALSVSDAAEDVIAVIRAGAGGYVTKTIEPDELVSAIERRPRRRRGVLTAAGRFRARRVPRRSPDSGGP